MCVAAAIGGAAAAGLAGSAISASGAQSAANTQAQAQEQAAQVQQNMFNTINGQEQPFINNGGAAGTALDQLLGIGPGSFEGFSNGAFSQNKFTPFSFDPSSITSSPGYQFAQQQGLQAVQNAAAPSVGALSGPALKDMLNFSTGTAAQYYNNYFNQALNQYSTNFNAQQTQQNNIFSRLSAIAGLGQNAASNTGNAGAQLGTGAAQAIAGAGASQAAGTVGAANAISSGLNNAGSYLTLNSLLSQGGGAANPVYGTTAAGNPNYFTMAGS